MRRPMVCLVTLAHAACGGQPPPAPRSEEIAAPEPPPRPAAPFKAVFPAWYEPAEPFRVIGELYSVGPRGLGVFLLPTSEGHILIDGGVPESPPSSSRTFAPSVSTPPTSASS